MLNILVMGAGAIGCFVGGSLAAQGHQVTLVGRPSLMERIAATGLTIRWPGKSKQTVFPKTETTITALTTTYDFILITVKAPDTAATVKQLARSIQPTEQTYLVSLQNGIGNEEQLADHFSARQVIAGTITIPIQVTEPGVIEVSKAKGGLGLAPFGGSPPVGELADALNRAGLVTETYVDYRAMKWSKLMLNIVNNASSAILDEPPAQIIACPDLFDLEIEALRECVRVMKAQAIDAVALPGYPVNWLARLVGAWWLPRPVTRAILRPFLRSGRGAKMPSLQIDLAAGRATSEIGVLNGAIVAAGQQYGLATPVNRALTDILEKLVSKQLRWADYQHQPEKLIAAAIGL
jgi:2-dehydropantoate 2-reductase